MLGLRSSLLSSGVPTDNLLNLTTKLALWLQHNTATPAQWNDSSGNENHATQSSALLQGALVEGGLDFEETDAGDNIHETHYDLTNMITVAAEQGFCIAWVMKQETQTNNTLISDTSHETIRIQNANKIRLLTNAPGDIESIYHASSGPFTSGAKALFMLNRTSGGSSVVTLYKNGSAVTLDASSGNSTLADAGENNNGFSFDTIGAANSGTNHFFDGILYELAFWTKELSATEIADVNSYLKTKHAL